MSNEELFFGLSQDLHWICGSVIDEVVKPANGRKSQMLTSSIIILKTALDALPFLSKVFKDAKCFLLCNIYRSICENPRNFWMIIFQK
ncbi:hypothetical protein DsansV1_C38g0232981 [Dioscorea sansibarensis]